jgi:hypothetical protein
MPQNYRVVLNKKTGWSHSHVGKCWPFGAARFLLPSMSLTRTMSCAEYLTPRMVCTVLLLRLGCLLMPRLSSPAPWAASVSAFPRAAREAPLGASTCSVFSVKWSCPRVLLYQFCAQCSASPCHVLDSVTLSSLLRSWFPRNFPVLVSTMLFVIIDWSH